MSGSSGDANPTRILLATGNPAKQETLRWLLEGLSLETVAPRDLGLDSVPEEEGETHEEIARMKAREWSQAGSMLAIATDGGLVIPALGNRWESRFTHRFAGPAADDAERLRRLREIMEPFQGKDREATWVEAIAIADQGRVLQSWELQGGTGVIADSDDALSPLVPGFWVFSAWYFPRYSKTYNQLSPQEQEALGDHWTRFRQLVQDYFKTSFAGSLS